MSLEDLMNVEVTTVSKRREAIFDAPAAVYAITAEEIRRSGARTLPEVFRVVPGVEVAQIDASKWALTARGYDGRFANKLQAMIDGRSIYTPLFSGVYWAAHNLLLEDVERIEVVRGPGGTLWGANAVNGVINVITKPAADTQGLFVEGGGGSEEQGFGSIRYGAGSGKTDFRIYGTGFERDERLLAPGVDAADGWRGGQGGIRLDWHRSERDEVILQGDTGNDDLDAEVLLAYEAGLRTQAPERFFFDLSAFFHDYDKATGLRRGEPFVDLRDSMLQLAIPVGPANNQTGRARGLEGFARVQIIVPWQVAGGYSCLDLELEPESLLQFADFEAASPRHQAQLRSYLDLPRDVELDSALYFNDELSGFAVDSYWRLDLRLGWRPRRGSRDQCRIPELARRDTSGVRGLVLRGAEPPISKAAAHEPDTPAAIFDRDRALERLGDDEGLLCEITELFLDESPKLLEQLRNAVASADSEGARRVAHTLKGTVANFAAEPTRLAALRMERIAEACAWDEASEAIVDLERRLAELEAALLAALRDPRTADSQT